MKVREVITYIDRLSEKDAKNAIQGDRSGCETDG